MTDTNPIHNIRQVTMKGMFINTFLMILKFVAAFVGHSSAMLADAIHSFSDFLTDIIILLQVKFGLKPRDDRHDYGYGKIATLITLLFGIVLLVLGRRRLVPAPDVDLAHETKEYLESFPFRSPIVVFFMNENAVDKFMGDLGRHRCYIGMFLNKIRKLTNFII